MKLLHHLVLQCKLNPSQELYSLLTANEAACAINVDKKKLFFFFYRQALRVILSHLEEFSSEEVSHL